MKTIQQIHDKFKSSFGRMVETNNDLSPYGKIAYAMKMAMLNPNEVSAVQTKGDLELF